MQPPRPNAKKYLESRNAARQLAKTALIDNHPEVVPLVELQNEYIAGVMLSLSGCDFSKLAHGLYISDLVVSFTRTHFIAQDLIGYCELIEAAVLIRKQFELLARLHELVKADKLEHLVCKTPNIREAGEHIRRLYSAYSEVAHSSNPTHLQLLGRITVNGCEHTPVYPMYDPNAVITLRHQVLTVIAFYDWSYPYLSSVVSDFDAATANGLIADLAYHYMQTSQSRPLIDSAFPG